MKDYKPTLEKYFKAYTESDVDTILEIVSHTASIQSGQQDWASAPMVLPHLLGASTENKYVLNEIFTNEDGLHFIIHFDVVSPKGEKMELLKMVKFDLYGKISFIRLINND